MTKQEFLSRLRKGLSGLPQSDIEERLAFYGEMIDDRIEEGFSEEDAVSAVGDANEIIAQTVAEIPLTKIAKERIKKARRLKDWEIILLVLGSPVWVPLCISAAAVVLSVYISLWSVIITLWSVFASLVGCAFGAIASGVGFTVAKHGLTGIALIGAGLVLAGLSIFAFHGCKAATDGIVTITKKFALWIKNCFIKKEEAQ